jgi:RNA 2',3'-cyclic 3'-phosphodiesterase
MRLFIAVDLPKELGEAFSEASAKIKGARCSRAKQFHLTLKFLGEVPDYKLHEIKQRLSTISENGFEAKTSEIGVFPNYRNIRVVWAGLEPVPDFERLHQAVDKALLPLFPAEQRFVPHLTLARVKSAEDKKELADSVSKLQILAATFNVTKILLKKSTLTSNGPIYDDLLEINLK